MTVTILQGDALTVLKGMDAESVDCVVTSPPYWGLRDYKVPPRVWGGDPKCKHVWGEPQRTAWANGVPGPNGAKKNPKASRQRPKETGPFCLNCGAWKGCLGLEPTLGMHINIMVSVFAEVHRVLKPTGTCWVNYGDCYATQKNGRPASDVKFLGNDNRTFRDKPFSTTGGTLKPRDLCLMPHRFAIAMQDFGWWVRSDITWGKPNAMPDSSGRYRPSTASERIFLFHKETPYYDAEAVRMPPADASIARWAQDTENQKGSDRQPGKTNGPMKAVGGPKKDKQRGHSRRHAGFNDRWDAMSKAEQQANGRLLRNYEPDLTPLCGQEVWEIPTASFSEAHFATFPPALVIPCIMAGSADHGVCRECGAPWVRLVESKYTNPGNRKSNGPRSLAQRHESPGFAKRLQKHTKTLGWEPSCGCQNTDIVPAMVLDPFAGAGTTGLVADRLGRDCTLIELNPEYIEIARARIKGDCPMFVEVAAE